MTEIMGPRRWRQPQTDPAPQAMEDGRLLIQHGRSWLTLTEEDIDRGARAVVRDPYYREEIAHCAILHAQEVRDGFLAAEIINARDRLDAQ